MEGNKLNKLLKNCQQIEKKNNDLSKDHIKLIPLFIEDILKHKEEFNLSKRVITNLQNKLKEISGGVDN